MKQSRHARRTTAQTCAAMPESCMISPMKTLASLSLILPLALFAPFAMHCARAPSEHQSRITRNIVYGNAFMAEKERETPTPQPLRMDVIAPPRTVAPPYPAAILIHGGAFERGARNDEQQVQLAHTLAKHGYACFLIAYRLIRDNPPAPLPYDDPLSKAAHAAVVDTKTALRHVHANAAAYEVDPHRVALIGASAGAIAALGAGLSEPDQFSDDGPDFPPPPENNTQVEARAAAIVNLWGTADFFLELFSENAPPIMTVHGAKDFTTGLSLLPAENIDAQCREHGVPHHYYPLSDAGHGPWDAMVDGKPLDALVLQFLDTYLK